MDLAGRIPIGISSCQIFPEGKIDLDLIRSVAQRAEQLGYDLQFIL